MGWQNDSLTEEVGTGLYQVHESPSGEGAMTLWRLHRRFNSYPEALTYVKEMVTNWNKFRVFCCPKEVWESTK